MKLKIILILCALISVVKGNNDCLSQKDLKVLEETFHSASAYMKREVKEEDIVLCIGATRAGKSTLVNYLIDNKLKAERINKYTSIKISKVDNESPGPEIGFGSTSKTTIPKRWSSKKLPQIAIWDAPGFDDNRGAIQDITNAFYLHQLIQNVKSMKIILTIDINDILHDNIKPFLLVLSAVENLLGDKMKPYFTSISVIFTKVPNKIEDIPLDMEFINEKLFSQFLSNSEMDISKISKEFIQFLIKNNNRIAFFKRPEEIGPITSAIDVNIFPVIENSQRIDKYSLKEISPSISEQSRICLYKVRETLYSLKSLEELQNDFIADMDNTAKVVNNFNGAIKFETFVRDVLSSLIGYEKKLNIAIIYSQTFPEKLKAYGNVHRELSRKLDELKIIEKYNLMKFVDKLLNLNESKQFEFAIQAVLRSSLLRVKETENIVRKMLNSIIQKKYEIQRIEERRRQQEELDRLYWRLEQERREANKGFWERLGDFFG
ncbi:uncharacterized protein LOC122500350 [Leptopilina heterotoma]|uniref:uncharacterized protein LOC122500350 n=1 Tax=Leptopilina heterotoma TaxID=63436 RepID=UPI001CA84B57|nr:uncharacterized protein LOC122500350 [Leptopilina heterotoma]